MRQYSISSITHMHVCILVYYVHTYVCHTTAFPTGDGLAAPNRAGKALIELEGCECDGHDGCLDSMLHLPLEVVVHDVD